MVFKFIFLKNKPVIFQEVQKMTYTFLLLSPEEQKSS